MPGLHYRRELVLALVAISSTMLSVACGKSDLAWNEEVQLSSGQVIVVKRTAQARSLGEIGGPGGWEAEAMTVEIIEPQLADRPAAWSFPFVPILFDRDPGTGEWFMVATFYTCERWQQQLGKPKLPYGEWRFRQGQWQRVELSPVHVGRAANMLISISSAGEPNHTLKSKDEIMSDRRIAPEYRRIFADWPQLCGTPEPVKN